MTLWFLPLVLSNKNRSHYNSIRFYLRLLCTKLLETARTSIGNSAKFLMGYSTLTTVLYFHPKIKLYLHLATMKWIARYFPGIRKKRADFLRCNISESICKSWCQAFGHSDGRCTITNKCLCSEKMLDKYVCSDQVSIKSNFWDVAEALAVTMTVNRERPVINTSWGWLFFFFFPLKIVMSDQQPNLELRILRDMSLVLS